MWLKIPIVFNAFTNNHGIRVGVRKDKQLLIH